jgi:hypothetical protein
MAEYRSLLERGGIQKAYQGLMKFVMDLRTRLEKKYPDYSVSGIYQGYMDMTYFAVVPESLKDRRLKIAIVFVYDTFRFEVWLAGANKRVQAEHWKKIRDSGWDKYRLVPTTKGADSIVEHVLADNPNFGDPAALMEQIERGTLEFIRDVEGFLSS